MAAPWDRESLVQAIKQDSEFSKKCPSLAADVSSRRLSLVTLVEYLRELLTDPEPSNRALGITALSSVLKELPLDFLVHDEVQFIIIFFCDRLKDHHDVIPSTLEGILAILKMKNVGGDLPITLLNTLILNVTCQSQRQEDRLKIYRILDLLIIPHFESLKCRGPDLVYHIISTIDGESDPRNLKFLFSMLPSIIKILPLGHLCEDFFEVMSCYFPIDFRQSADPNNKVTRKDLSVLLAECLTAIPAFAEFCIPLLLEKMDSSLQLAKEDSLYLLKRGSEKFSAKDLAVHLSPIWMSLSKESLLNQDFDIRESARQCVTGLLQCLSELPLVNGQQSDPVRQLLGDVVAAAMSPLAAVHTSLFMAASDLLLAAAKSCPLASEHILVMVMPTIVDYCNSKPDPGERAVYLRFISRFLTVCKTLDVTPQKIPDISIQWNLLGEMYFLSAEHEAYLVRKEALFGLTLLAPTLNLNQRIKLYNMLCDIVDTEINPEAREQMYACLCEVASNQSAEVLNLILTDKLNISDLAEADPKIKKRLEARCRLAAFQAFTQEILPEVVDLIVSSGNNYKINSAIVLLRELLERSATNSTHLYDCLHKQCKIIPRLFDWWISSLFNVHECDWVNNEASVLETSNVICLVTRNLEKEEQLPLVQLAFRHFSSGSNSLKPFELSSPRHYFLMVPLLEAVLGSLSRSISVPELHDLCCTLTKLAVNCQEPLAVISASRLCASLLNKLHDAKLLDDILSDISSVLQNVTASSGINEAMQAATFYGWLIKGLAMRGYEHLDEWIERLVKILGDSRPPVALAATKAFQVIMGNSPVFMTLESHCMIRMLYKQRIFERALRLIEKSKESSAGERNVYLLALPHLLTGVSASVLTSNIEEVMPLLMESLSQESTHLLEAVLDTLYRFLQQSISNDSIHDYIPSVIRRVTPLTNYKHSMDVRRKATNCLTELHKFPTEVLLPFKEEVIMHLQVCLDDPKRIVRQEAVKARSRWMLIGAP